MESVLGRGGMGIVVQARHLALDELVAIKLLRDDVTVDEETRARFVREAQAAAKLKSEHVARIIDVGQLENEQPYMVMEFLEGQDLGALIKERGKLHPSLAIDLLIQTCDALAEAHALGIVHRDIKPTNLFLTSHPDGTLLLKVLDFGISKATNGVDLSLTQTASMLGTPAYMSPEQMRSARRVDVRTDIWSLGSVLYEALEGHLPFQAESFSEMCVMVAVDPPAAMVAAPASLAAIVERCLAKHPDQRYQTVAELARDLATHAREPAKARMAVDRMFRMLGRARVTPNPAATPVVGIPITPQPFASPTSPTVGTVAAPHSLALSQVRVRPRRWPMVAALVGVLAAAGVVVGIGMTRDDATAVSAPAAAPPAPTGTGSADPPATTDTNNAATTGSNNAGPNQSGTNGTNADTTGAHDTATTGTRDTTTDTHNAATDTNKPDTHKADATDTHDPHAESPKPHNPVRHLPAPKHPPRPPVEHTVVPTEGSGAAKPEPPGAGKGSDKPSPCSSDPFASRKGC